MPHQCFMMMKLLKEAKTRLSRWTVGYRTWFRCRSFYYGACEALSAVVSRLLGKECLIGVDLLSVSDEPVAPRHGLAAFLRFKNEASYLAEWIQFHRQVGFDHFYLYNNGSTDQFEEVLEPYVREGIVTLHDWPTSPASPAADLHCVRHYRRDARWIAFIDADEFLFPTGADDDFKSLLAEFDGAPAVAVNWIYYGSGGHDRRPEGLVIENYRLRAAQPNRHVKVIINPRKAIRYGNSHHWFYTAGTLAVNEAGQPVCGSFHEPATVERLRINHYYCKSAEEFLAKASMKSWVDREGAKFPSRTKEAVTAAIRANNETEDARACRFAGSIQAPGCTTL